jgi:hypothetical protein
MLNMKTKNVSLPNSVDLISCIQPEVDDRKNSIFYLFGVVEFDTF